VRWVRTVAVPSGICGIIATMLAAVAQAFGRFAMWAVFAALAACGTRGLRLGAATRPVSPEVTVAVLPVEGGDLDATAVTSVEQLLRGLPGLRRIERIAVRRLANVRCIFAPGTDVFDARAGVVRRLAQASLPDGVLATVVPTAGERMAFVLHGAPGTTLRDVFDWELGRELRRLPGVSDVIGCGGDVREIHVSIDPYRLSAIGLSIDDVTAVVSRRGGAPPTDEGYVVRGSILADPQNLLDAPLRSTVRLRDVATVSDAIQDRRCAAMLGGEPALAGWVLLRDSASAEQRAAVLQALQGVAHQRGLAVETLPWFDRGITLRLQFPPLALRDSMAIMASVQRQLATMPDVRASVARAGVADDQRLLRLPGEIDVDLQLAQPGDSATAVAHIREALRSRLPGLGSVFPLRDTVRWWVPARDACNARRVQALRDSTGVLDVTTRGCFGLPTMTPRFDVARLQRFGIRLPDAQLAWRAATDGVVIGQTVRDGHRRDVVVRLATADAARDAMLTGHDGVHIPLSVVAVLETTLDVPRMAVDGTDAGAIDVVYSPALRGGATAVGLTLERPF
jgi:Cu/Ag efflux pump CusA